MSPSKAPSQYPDNLKTVVGSMYWIGHRSMLNSGLRTNQLLLIHVIWKVLFCCYLHSQYQIKLFYFLASLWFVAIRTKSSANTKTVTFPFLKLMFSVVLSSLLMAESNMRLKESRDSGPPCLLPLFQQVHCQRLVYIVYLFCNRAIAFVYIPQSHWGCMLFLTRLSSITLW